jgi:hypothetical protein
LALGALIAVGLVPNIKRRTQQELTSALGVGLIIFSLFYIDSGMIFPGWVALIPCIGTAMVIHAGGETFIAKKFLGARFMVFIGLLSYSLYLWHWPVLTLMRIRTASVNLSFLVACSAVLITFLLAWLSWRYVERPFRNKNSLPAGRMLTLIGSGSAIVIFVATLSIYSGGFPKRLNEETQAALSASKDIDFLRVHCTGMEIDRGCRFGNLNEPITYAIIGDSHAAALRPAIEASNILNAAGTLYWMGACPFLSGAKMINAPERKNCNSFKSQLWKKIASDKNLTTIVLAGRWPYQMTGWLPESGGSYRSWLVDNETVRPSIEENARVFVRSFQRTLDRIAELGLDVIIVGSVPEAGFDVPHTIALARYAGVEQPHGIKRSAVESRAGKADKLIAELTSGRSGVRFISIWEDFCDDSWCKLEDGGKPIYYDDDHISYHGALSVVAPAIARHTND